MRPPDSNETLNRTIPFTATLGPAEMMEVSAEGLNAAESVSNTKDAESLFISSTKPDACLNYQLQTRTSSL